MTKVEKLIAQLMDAIIEEREAAIAAVKPQAEVDVMARIMATIGIPTSKARKPRGPNKPKDA